MPIYGHGLVYDSATTTAKDAGVAPDSGSYPVWSGFGEGVPVPRATQIGLYVGLASVLGSVTMFLLTLRLGGGRR
jgi:hypothetical protein